MYAYVVEVHPTSPENMPYAGRVMESPCSIPQAYNYSTRLANANLVNSKLCHTTEGFGPDVTVMIDDLTPHNTTGNNPVWCMYGQGPNMGFVIAQNGTVVQELDWFSGASSSLISLCVALQHSAHSYFNMSLSVVTPTLYIRMCVCVYVLWR